MSGPMITTWPVFTEAMYLLGDVGWRAQQALWSLLLRDDLQLAELVAKSIERTHELMKKYRDRPMSLADATLVVVAEDHGLKRIFSLDSDFDFYRIRGRERFERIPN